MSISTQISQTMDRFEFWILYSLRINVYANLYLFSTTAIFIRPMFIQYLIWILARVHLFERVKSFLLIGQPLTIWFDPLVTRIKFHFFQFLILPIRCRAWKWLEPFLFLRPKPSMYSQFLWPYLFRAWFPRLCRSFSIIELNMRWDAWRIGERRTWLRQRW